MWNEIVFEVGLRSWCMLMVERREAGHWTGLGLGIGGVFMLSASGWLQLLISGVLNHYCPTIHSHHTPLSTYTQNESLYFSRWPQWQRREPHCCITSFTPSSQRLWTPPLCPVFCTDYADSTPWEGWWQGPSEIRQLCWSRGPAHTSVNLFSLWRKREMSSHFANRAELCVCLTVDTGRHE